MTDQATRVVAAGWYEDPSNADQVRWWNGIAWTDHTQPKPTASDGAAITPASDARRSDARRAGTRVIRAASTAESWLVAFTPVLLAAALLVAAWATLYVAPNPAWLVLALVVTYAASVGFAFLDQRKLTRARESAPPTFAMLLTAPVYLVLRGLRVQHSWSQLIAWALLMVGLIVAPAIAWAAGALDNVRTAVTIQSEVRDELVGSGVARQVACPPITDTIAIGSIYSCDVTLTDGSRRTLWVSIDSADGDYSTAFSIR